VLGRSRKQAPATSSRGAGRLGYTAGGCRAHHLRWGDNNEWLRDRPRMADREV